MTAKKARDAGKDPAVPRDSQARKAPSGASKRAVPGFARPPVRHVQQRKIGGWREIEALRERAALKASLADVWDEDFDLDEEILAELDHTAEFFTSQDNFEEEPFEDDDLDDYYEDDDEEV